MAPPSIIRIRLDLRKIKQSFQPLIWFSVDTSLIHTIFDLKKLIINRINIFETDDLSLYCQDCYLPSDETIAIVRDEDLLRIYCNDQHTFLQERHDPYSNCFAWATEKECKISHKKRKRNSCDDAKDLCSNSEVKRNKTETSEICNSIASENIFKKKHRKKKKHNKDKLDYSESNAEPKFIEGTNDVSTSLINNDSSSENIKKKRKKHSKNTEATTVANDTEIAISINTEPIKISEKTLQQTNPRSSITLGSADKASDDIITISKILPQQQGTDKSPSNNCKKKRKRSRKRKNKTNNYDENVPDFEKPNKESINKEYLESSIKSNLEHTSFLPTNKHVKFTDTEENDLILKSSPDEKSSNQNTSQAQSFFSDELSFITSSPLESMIPKNGIVSTSPKREDSENSKSLRTNCMNLVANIQNRYKERQLAAINTNISTIYMNNQHSETFNGENRKPSIPAEKKDYKKYSILKGPPRIGDLVAYKILELSADYCPQMSDYKEGKVISYNDETDDIEVELTATNKLGSKNKGKFDLPNIENDINQIKGSDGKSTVIVNWAAMVEPRLIS